MQSRAVVGEHLYGAPAGVCTFLRDMARMAMPHRGGTGFQPVDRRARKQSHALPSYLSARLRALWSFGFSSHATSAFPCPKRFSPASLIAESGTVTSGVYRGWWCSIDQGTGSMDLRSRMSTPEPKTGAAARRLIDARSRNIPGAASAEGLLLRQASGGIF